MTPIVLIFGLIAGAILSAMMLATIPFQDAIGDSGEVIGYTTMVVAFLLVFFGVRQYRDKVAGGSLSFGRAFSVGALIVVVASLCYVVTWEAIYYKIAPEYADKMFATMVEKARTKGGTQAEIDKRVADMQKLAEWYKNPVLNSAITFLEPLPVGLIIALVAAGVLRRRRSTTAPAGAAAVAI